MNEEKVLRLIYHVINEIIGRNLSFKEKLEIELHYKSTKGDVTKRFKDTIDYFLSRTEHSLQEKTAFLTNVNDILSQLRNSLKDEDKDN